MGNIFHCDNLIHVVCTFSSQTEQQDDLSSFQHAVAKSALFPLVHREMEKTYHNINHLRQLLQLVICQASLDVVFCAEVDGGRHVV
jgi:hypothetical protein